MSPSECPTGSPALSTYGLLRPVILLPRGMDRENETVLSHILTHEYVHIRYLDGLTKLVLAGTLCVHWWNPAVWLMVVLANRIWSWPATRPWSTF